MTIRLKHETRQLLTVELVPRTSWYRNVRSHVSRAEWEQLRSVTFASSGGACEICGARSRLECHEVWHYDDERHIQKLLRLIALCPACHEVKHIGLAGARGRSREAVAHLARVNGWSHGDARHYLEACFELWSARSNHPWSLDLTQLRKDKGGRMKAEN